MPPPIYHGSQQASAWFRPATQPPGSRTAKRYRAAPSGAGGGFSLYRWDIALGPRRARAVVPPRERRDGPHPDRRAAPDLPCQVHDHDLWFADAPADLELAKALCADCPALLACLAGALDRREPVGVWGGQIFQAGRVVSFKRPRGRPRRDSTPPEHFTPLPDAG